MWIKTAIELQKLGKYHEAVRACEYARAERPDNSDAWSLEVDILEKLGRHDEAERVREQAKKLMK